MLENSERERLLDRLGTPPEMIKHADALLYRAMQTGRNAVGGKSRIKPENSNVEGLLSLRFKSRLGASPKIEPAKIVPR